MDESNGHRSELVRFGDAPGNALNAAILPDVLRKWHQRNAEEMGAIVAEVMFGTPPKVRRRSARAQ